MHDAPLLRLAGRQHGLVAMRQLVPLGYNEHHIRWRIRVGLLFRVYRGVYAVAGSADTFEFRVMAAVLAAGDGAVASHRCAAALYGLRRIRCDRPSITVSGRGAPELHGIDRRRRDTLSAVDRARVGVIAVTAPAWTLLDLAGEFDLANDVERWRLGGALDDVLVRKLASLRAIGVAPRAGFRRARARSGRARRVGRRATSRQETVRDRAGRRAARDFEVYGLPRAGPAMRPSLAWRWDGALDAAYSDLLLGFEADGDAYHRGLLDRMRDEARDEAYRRLGWTVRPYATDDLRLRPAAVADDVIRLRAEAVAA